MKTNNENENRRKLIPVSAFPAYFPEMQLSESRIRWWIFNAEDNGFKSCIRRIGRRIFIDVDEFLSWIDRNSTSN
jgi:hypothetical protein